MVNTVSKSIWKIFIMNLALLGVQVGFTLQTTNMSGIYEYFGAKPDQIPILWLAMPFSGLFIQPIIGVWSDRTYGKFGRRKPYIFTGTTMAALSLLIIPYCSTLSSVILLVWILNCAINIALGPLRAFVADNLAEEQINLGYSIQGILIAFGTLIAACSPWIFTHIFSIGIRHDRILPSFIKISFVSGGIIMFTTGLFTIFSGAEPPLSKNLIMNKKNIFFEIISDITKMPKPMLKIAAVQFLAWLGLFGVFMYFPILIANNIFRNQKGIPSYDYGMEWAGICFGLYAVTQLFVSFIIPYLSKKFAEKYVLLITLLSGGIGILSVFYFETQYGVFWSMLGLGIMIAGINILPFSILGKILHKEKIGVYMGIFNIFITVPGVLLSFVFGPIIHYVFSDSIMFGVVISGISMIIAAIIALSIRLPNQNQS